MLEPFIALLETPAFRLMEQIYVIFAATAFIWGPIISIWLAQKLWLEYVRADYVKKNFDFILLEIKLPRVSGKRRSPWNWYSRHCISPTP